MKFVILSEYTFIIVFIFPRVCNCTYLDECILMKLCMRLDNFMQFKIRDARTIIKLYRLDSYTDLVFRMVY